MYIKIFFGNKPVYLCNATDAELNELLHHPETLLMEEVSAASVHTMLHEIVQPNFQTGIMIHPDLEALKKMFFRSFTKVTAAGGVVENEHQEILLIFRKGKWDLPKGKLDPSETIEACAVREVMEETGLKEVQLGNALMVTYHTYEEYGKKILKDSHWYKMFANGSQPLTPQTEEDIQEIRWVAPQDLKRYAAEAFPSVNDVLRHL